MIKRNDIQEEVEKAEKVINDPKADINAKVGVLFTLNTVMIKILVNVRTNTKLIFDNIKIIMKHLNLTPIELPKNPKQEEKKEGK
jgi:hypothetical protein